ncbi:hypothetical protein M758_3G254600 [Ceratodon purpureus]|nr:hypothetical protein M758_3G254600 [Ceratodon purpureus]
MIGLYWKFQLTMLCVRLVFILFGDQHCTDGFLTNDWIYPAEIVVD